MGWQAADTPPPPLGVHPAGGLRGAGARGDAQQAGAGRAREPSAAERRRQLQAAAAAAGLRLLTRTKKRQSTLKSRVLLERSDRMLKAATAAYEQADATYGAMALEALRLAEQLAATREAAAGQLPPAAEGGALLSVRVLELAVKQAEQQLAPAKAAVERSRQQLRSAQERWGAVRKTVHPALAAEAAAAAAAAEAAEQVPATAEEAAGGRQQAGAPASAPVGGGAVGAATGQLGQAEASASPAAPPAVGTTSTASAAAPGAVLPAAPAALDAVAGDDSCSSDWDSDSDDSAAGAARPAIPPAIQPAACVAEHGWALHSPVFDPAPCCLLSPTRPHDPPYLAIWGSNTPLLCHPPAPFTPLSSCLLPPARPVRVHRRPVCLGRDVPSATAGSSESPRTSHRGAARSAAAATAAAAATRGPPC